MWQERAEPGSSFDLEPTSPLTSERAPQVSPAILSGNSLIRLLLAAKCALRFSVTMRSALDFMAAARTFEICDETETD